MQEIINTGLGRSVLSTNLPSKSDTVLTLELPFIITVAPMSGFPEMSCI